MAHYEYSAYGELLISSGIEAQNNSYLFSTKYFDKEIKKYGFGYRYLDQATGRWMSQDPLGEQGGMNLYCLGHNSAVNGVDDLGMKWVEMTHWSEAKKDETREYFVRRNYVCEFDGGSGSYKWQLRSATRGYVVVIVRVEERKGILERWVPWYQPIKDVLNAVVTVKGGFGWPDVPIETQTRYEDQGFFKITFPNTWKTKLGNCNCENKGKTDYTERPTYTRWIFGNWTSE